MNFITKMCLEMLVINIIEQTEMSYKINLRYYIAKIYIFGIKLYAIYFI